MNSSPSSPRSTSHIFGRVWRTLARQGEIQRVRTASHQASDETFVTIFDVITAPTFSICGVENVPANSEEWRRLQNENTDLREFSGDVIIIGVRICDRGGDERVSFRFFPWL